MWVKEYYVWAGSEEDDLFDFILKCNYTARIYSGMNVAEKTKQKAYFGWSGGGECVWNKFIKLDS